MKFPEGVAVIVLVVKFRSFARTVEFQFQRVSTLTYLSRFCTRSRVLPPILEKHNIAQEIQPEEESLL